MAEKLIITIDYSENCFGFETATETSRLLRIKCYEKAEIENLSDEDFNTNFIKLIKKESCIILNCRKIDLLNSYSNKIRVLVMSSKQNLQSELNSYDICINTDIIGAEGAKQIILEYLVTLKTIIN